MAVLGFLFTGITLSSFLLLMLTSPGGYGLPMLFHGSKALNMVRSYMIPHEVSEQCPHLTAPLALPFPFAFAGPEELAQS